MNKKRYGVIEKVSDAKRTVWVSFEGSPKRDPQAFKLSRTHYNIKRPLSGDRVVQHENKQLEIL